MDNYYDNKCIASIVEEMLTPTTEASVSDTTFSKEYQELSKAGDKAFGEGKKLAKEGKIKEAKEKYSYALSQYRQLMNVVSTVKSQLEQEMKNL